MHLREWYQLSATGPVGRPVLLASSLTADSGGGEEQTGGGSAGVGRVGSYSVSEEQQQL